MTIVLVSHSNDLKTCMSGKLRIYYIGMLVILSLELLFSIAIMCISMKGTIMNDQPRESIPNLIISKFFLFLIEIGWTIMGTIWVFSGQVQNCSHVIVNIMKWATIVFWIILLLLIVGVIIAFDTLGSSLSDTPAELQRLWKMR